MRYSAEHAIAPALHLPTCGCRLASLAPPLARFGLAEAAGFELTYTMYTVIFTCPAKWWNITSGDLQACLRAPPGQNYA